ncbi:Plastin-2 [Sphagnurus paluster]|uniref:Plastin-2 n=1 Tax=Sphagnurus paluster TaxID=117069 RepID=A0A9P7G8H7_9AGAR|nr:Plastin-2 [Sphagnurus paluster]
MFIVALALVAVVAAAPVEEPEPIVRSDFEQSPEGSYTYSFETQKGIVRQEEGQVKEALDEENKPHNVVVVRGSYSYPGEDGKPVSITYFADETGFHAEGDSIPKPARR